MGCFLQQMLFSIKFWKGKWLLGNGALTRAFIASIPDCMLDGNLVEYVSTNRNWKIDSFRHYLSNHLLSQILLMIPLSIHANCDVFSWNGTSDGLFSMRTTYKLVIVMLCLISLCVKWMWSGTSLKELEQYFGRWIMNACCTVQDPQNTRGILHDTLRHMSILHVSLATGAQTFSL